MAKKNFFSLIFVKVVEVGPLIRACKGFEIELGKKLTTQPNKRLVDTTKNTPYYQHYFFSKGWLVVVDSIR